MKKNMLIAITVMAFFSCTELLDEISITDEGKEIIADSLQNSIGKGDSTIVEDPTIVEEDEPHQEEISGNNTFYTKAEIENWKNRIKSGPYRMAGDAGQNTPGDWSRIMENAKKVLTKPDIFNGNNPDAWHAGHSIRDAALVYMLTGEYANEVKRDMLAQIRNPATKFKNWTFLVDKGSPGHTDYFMHANWLTRIFYAYTYSHDLFNESEQQEIKQWFIEAAQYFAEVVDRDLKKNFPNRLNGDYSKKSNVAALQKTQSQFSEFAYVDANGVPRNQISWTSQAYNNRTSSQIMPVGLIGVHFENSSLIHHYKTYFKEFLMFGTYPDGSTGEFKRNDGNASDYKTEETGTMYYDMINIETMIVGAMALHKKGDNELFDYSTSAGLHGTEGGNKTLKLLIDTRSRLINHDMEWYWKEKKSQYRHDAVGGGGRLYYAFDVIFAYANQYYKDDYIKTTYLRNKAVKYPSSGLSSAGPVWWPWSGPTSTLPGYLFLYGQLEDSDSQH